MKKLFFGLFVSLIVFCTLVVIIEAFGQITYYLKNGIFIYQTYEGSVDVETFELHPYLVGRPKKNITVKGDDLPPYDKELKTTSNYTRWTGAPDDDSKLIRVAVLGGSTALGVGVTDEDSWPALLQDKLGDQFAVINFGVSGYSTAEAIIQMALIVPETKPEIVILYEGWNDIRNYHETELGADYYVHGISQYENLEIPIRYKKKTFLEMFYGLSSIGKLASKIKLKLSGPPDIQPCPKFDTPDPFVDRIYVRNLKTLKLLSEEIATYTLFVPQVLNYEAFMEMEEPVGCNYWTRHIKNSALPQLMDKFNLLMQEVDPKCWTVLGLI